jgi:hypothetical protein
VQIYYACEERGRIAYKRSGGSRLITHNDHWKSQIRHALYTSSRFERYCDILHLATAARQLCSCNMDAQISPTQLSIALLIIRAPHMALQMLCMHC